MSQVDMKEIILKKDLAALAAFAFVVFFAVFFSFSAYNKSKTQASVALTSNADQEKKDTEFQNIFFVPELIDAKAYVVYDAKEKKALSEKNASVPLPLASLTKMAVATLVAEHLDKDYVVQITESDLKSEGVNGLVAGKRWRAHELASFMLVVSSNDASLTLKRALEQKTGKLFRELSRELSRKLGLKNTFFINPSGLDESAKLAGAYGSAKDIARLLSYSAEKYPEIFDATAKEEVAFKDLSGDIYPAKNTDKLAEYIFNMHAGKTGFTDLAGGNLAIVFEPEPDRSMVIVVLGSSKQGRFEAVRSLYYATLNYLN